MSGFDNAKVNANSFLTAVKANFLCNLGYGDSAKLFSAQPALWPFDEACLAL